jgi:hypothetical protein
MNADVVDVKSSLMDELDEVKESRRPAEKKFVDTIEDVEAKPEENNNP